MNFVTDDTPAPMNAPPMPMLPPPMSTTAPVVAPPVARVSRLWAVGAAVFGTLAVVACVSAWYTHERVRMLEQELVRRQQSSQNDATEAKLLARQALDSVREANGKLGVLDERVAESQLERSQAWGEVKAQRRSPARPCQDTSASARASAAIDFTG